MSILFSQTAVSNAADLVEAIKEMIEETGRPGETIYLEDENGARTFNLSMHQEILSDESSVFSLQITKGI